MADGAEYSRNWFDFGGESYSYFRPCYPSELAQFLAGVAPDTAFAVDVGCGNGQLTCQLATHFDKVLGLDSSSDQIAHATAHPRVEYACAHAEEMPVTDCSVSMITAAQAAHWFDLSRFYDEVRRIGVANAVLALVSYGVPRLDDELDSFFRHFYWSEISSYWPSERKLVDGGYAALWFPFAEQSAPTLEIRKDWNLGELLGYISTWSAVRRALEASCEDILHNFAADLEVLWGESARCREVRWPVSIRLGRL